MKLAKNSLAISLLLSSSAMFANEVPVDLATAHQSAEVVAMASVAEVSTVTETLSTSALVEDSKKEELQAALAVVAANLSPEILFSLVAKFVETQIAPEDREEAGIIFQDAGTRTEVLVAKSLRQQNLNKNLHQENVPAAEDVKQEVIEADKEASNDVAEPSVTTLEIVAADAQSPVVLTVSPATELEKAAAATEEAKN